MTARKIPSDLAGIRHVEESTFGTDPGSGYLTLLTAQNIKFTPAVSMHPVGYQKSSDMRGPDADVVGGKGGTLSFDMPLCTEGGSEAPVMTMMKRCGMSITSVAAGTGDITGGDINGDTFTVAVANIGNLAVGVAVMHVPQSGLPSLRFIDAKSGTATITFTVNASLQVKANAGDSWAAVDTIKASSGTPGAYNTFLVYQGQGSTDRLCWTLSGCAGTFKINTTDANALPMVSFEFQVDTWADSEANLARAAYAGNAPVPLLGDQLLINGTATDTRSVGLDPAMAMSPIPATSGTNGRSGFFYSGSEPNVEIAPLHDTAWLTKLEAGTTFDLMFSSVTSSTNAWGFWCPKTQVSSYETADSDGLLRGGMKFRVLDPGADAAGTLIPRFAIAVTK